MDDQIVPPNDMAAEQSILGAVLLGGASALTVVMDEGVRHDEFYSNAHGLIFKAMLELDSGGESVDAITVKNKLVADGNLDYVGGAAGVEMLAGSVPALGNLRTYCGIVRSKARWRRLRDSAYKQLEAVQLLDDEMHSRAMAEADQAEVTAATSAVDPAEDFMEWYAQDIRGWQTPFAKLTEALGGGLVPGDTTVIGGWPGHGKSIIADMFVHSAHSQDARCHIYMNELKSAFRTARMLSRMTGVPWWKIRDRELDNDQWNKILPSLKKLPAHYEKIEGWHVDEIARHIRRNRWDVAVVDTASRIPVRDIRDVERVSGMLADVAREVDTHLILVLKLNLERCKQAMQAGGAANADGP